MVWGVAQPRCRFGRLLVIITRRDERCVGEVMACYLPRTALGNMLKAEGRNVEAEAALRAATRVDPTFADACYNLGDLLDEQGRSEAAIECLSTALRVAPDYADAMFNLALLLQRKNQFAEAVDYWRRYLASDGQSEWAARARRSLKFCEMQLHLIASAAPTGTDNPDRAA